ncbi:MAG: ATP-binding cassette domain-containing protein, partial [Bacteroidales bacterium]|nr:ATP-binding cassette domain-containing protein [Bacteroidales bacterium]
MATVKLRKVNKIYDNAVQAVFDFNLTIQDKEFVVFVGPSGCGKSTTLRMIAGLEDITYGDVYIGDRLVNEVPPKDRDIAMVFQNYALFPHMTVYENIAFGLRIRKIPEIVRDKRGEEILVRDKEQIASLKAQLENLLISVELGDGDEEELNAAI